MRPVGGVRPLRLQSIEAKHSRHPLPHKKNKHFLPYGFTYRILKREGETEGGARSVNIACFFIFNYLSSLEEKETLGRPVMSETSMAVNSFACRKK